HRQARRGDAGERAGGDELRAVAGTVARVAARLLSYAGPAFAYSRRSDPQGWAVCWDHDGHYHLQRVDADSGAMRRRDDGGDYAARKGAPDRRSDREVDGRAPAWHIGSNHATGEREGPSRYPGRHQENHEAQFRGFDGRGFENRFGT